MKFSTLFFVATLASCTQALKLVYKVNSLGYQGTDRFDATLWLNGVELYTDSYRGSSQWKPLGIHKVQLKNAKTENFEFCLDVFGNVDCEKVWANPATCVWKPSIKNTECTNSWVENDWGSVTYY
ncbi:hypothetical protein BGX24_003114 [Mortierella sp. AD032]|nr:hypothetical protein BGX24_003114 [Mortierella sp. AD032]